MAKYGSDSVGFLLVDGFDLTADQTEVQESAEAIFEETTGLGVAWRAEKATGHQKCDLGIKGYYDDEALRTVEALVPSIAATRVAMLAHAGNVLGRKFIGWQAALQGKMERVSSKGGITKLNTHFTGAGARDEGVLVHILGADTGSSGNTESTSVDNAASSAAGAVCHLQVTAVTLGGYDDVVITVRKSTDNISFSDLVSFTAVTARTAERKTVAGTIPRYLATSYAFSGSGTGQSVTYAVGVARG